MATYTVKVWITQDQYDENGVTVRNYVEHYLENSTDYISHTINVTTSDDWIYAPQEDPTSGSSFTTTEPCGSPFGEVTYDDLLDWWNGYCHNCDIGDYDSRLLVTHYDGVCGGGEAIAEGREAVANGAYIENLGLWLDYNDSCGAYSLATCLQETGHNLMNWLSDDDGDGHHQHDCCDNKLHDDADYTTPMGAGYHDELDSYNECHEYVVPPDSQFHIDFNYDDCAGSKFK